MRWQLGCAGAFAVSVCSDCWLPSGGPGEPAVAKKRCPPDRPFVGRRRRGEGTEGCGGMNNGGCAAPYHGHYCDVARCCTTDEVTPPIPLGGWVAANSSNPPEKTAHL